MTTNPLKADIGDPVESLLNTIANQLAEAIADHDWDEVRRVEELCRKGLPE